LTVAGPPSVVSRMSFLRNSGVHASSAAMNWTGQLYCPAEQFQGLTLVPMTTASAPGSRVSTYHYGSGSSGYSWERQKERDRKRERERSKPTKRQRSRHPPPIHNPPRSNNHHLPTPPPLPLQHIPHFRHQTHHPGPPSKLMPPGIHPLHNQHIRPFIPLPLSTPPSNRRTRTKTKRKNSLPRSLHTPHLPHHHKPLPP
jgi:hypothetical protein